MNEKANLFGRLREVGVSHDLLEDEGYQHALNDDDMVGIYVKEAGKVPLLTAPEETSLAKRIEAAGFARADFDEDKSKGKLTPEQMQNLQEVIWDGELAQEHLIRANSRLVISIAKRFMGQGLPLLDLIQEGNIGLIRAVGKFEYQRGYKFSTYATWWIRQGVSRAVADQGRTIRVPVHIGEQLYKLRRVTLELQQELGRDPLPKELAEKMETTLDKILDLIEVSWRPLSLEGMIDNAGEGEAEWGDFIEDTDAPDPSDVSEESAMRERIEEVLNRLPDREAAILRWRYGLVGGRTHTLEEIGEKFGLTRERIRQLEAKAFNQLRRGSASVDWRDYLAD
jgi:RNA polymerase primary sigma factor